MGKPSKEFKIKEVKAYKETGCQHHGKWWTLAGNDLAREMFGVINKIQVTHAYRRQMNMNLERMYLGFSPIFQSTVYQNATRPELTGQRTVINVTKSAVDTAVSKIGTMKARPYFLTNGGNRSQMDRAENLTSFFDGLFYQMDFYPKMQTSFKDGCILNSGFLKPYIDHSRKKIACERVFPDEIIVDDMDAIYGEPRSIYQVKMIDRQTAKNMFPKYEKEINNASAIEANIVGGNQAVDNIWISEGWHLKSSEDSEDGCHAICFDNCTAFVEEYTRYYFPFIQQGWSKKPKGFWYSSIVEEGAGIQLDINATSLKIQDCHRLCAVPRVWVNEASHVNIEHITNEVGGVGTFQGQPPIFMTPNAVPPELYNHLQAQIMRYYELVGVSQMDAQSQKPVGLNSGVAIRTYQDVGSQRFKDQASRYEDAQMKAVDMIFDLCEELSEHHELEIMTPSKRMIKKINWKDARIDREDYILQRYPTNLLPTTPEGKKETVVDYINAGIMDKDIALELLDFPDLKAATNKILSESKILDKIIDKILNDGIYTTPEPYYNLELAMKKARQSYLMAEVEDYPEDKLQLLRNFMETIASLIQVQQEQQMQQMAAMQAAQGPAGAPANPNALPPMNGV
jgi:hypothetical protein